MPKDIEPNDRNYDRKIENTIKHMSAVALSELMYGVGLLKTQILHQTSLLKLFMEYTQVKLLLQYP